MIRHALIAALGIGLLSSTAWAVGFKGGGGGGRSVGGGARPAARPSPAARPAPSRPSVSRPSPSRPTTHPQTSAPKLGGARPSTTAHVPSRPTVSKPAVSKPPSRQSVVSHPAANRPTTGAIPTTRVPAAGFKPGTTLPGNIPGTTRPSTGNGPITRPGVINPGTSLPAATRPSLPGGATNRPSIPSLGGNGNRPTTLPSQPGLNRPGGGATTLPARPTPGNVGDFLGINKPVAPSPGDRPNLGNRPDVGNRPDLGNRPNIGNGPNIGNRPNIGNGIGNNINNRPVDIGRINTGNRVINNKPSWVNINNNQINNINVRMGNQIGGMRNWQTVHPERINRWNNWGNDVRRNWGYYHRHNDWFGPNWWAGHPHGFCGWHYYYGFNRHPWVYWWSVPTFAMCTNWFAWANTPVWTQPVYYDYGTGGNVVYQNNSVYMSGQPVATADEYAQSAAALATVSPPATQQEAEQAEWLPLGTFAVTADEKDVNPSRVMQLAVDRQGVISGTLYNSQTDQTQTIQGQVDKETQRVAFRIGESDQIVVETGLYNLTQEQTPVLVHFGPDKTETYLLVRLENPESESQ